MQEVSKELRAGRSKTPAQVTREDDDFSLTRLRIRLFFGSTPFYFLPLWQETLAHRVLQSEFGFLGPHLVAEFGVLRSHGMLWNNYKGDRENKPVHIINRQLQLLLKRRDKLSFYRKTFKPAKSAERCLSRQNQVREYEGI